MDGGRGLSYNAGVETVYRHRHRLALLLLLLVAAGLAWRQRFICDDAYISLRYARHFAQGAGLVWNAGERVEGYSNFLWTLWLAVPLRLQADPVAWAHASGITAALLTLLLAWFLARRLCRGPGTALLAVALLATNASFTAFATSGLETMLQALLTTALLLQATVLLQDGATGRQLAVLSLTAALAALNRPDGVLPGAVALAGALYALARGRQLRPGPLALLLLPVGAAGAAYAAWKLAYFGALLPNTFAAKVGGGAWAAGLAYLFWFAVSFALLPLLPVVLLRLRAGYTPSLLPVLAGTALWLAYVAAVGGDFMEFRFLVPLLPALLVLVVRTVTDGHLPRAVAGALVLLLVLGNLHHARYFGRTVRPAGIETVTQLSGHIWSSTHNWEGIGGVLREAFPAGEVRIAAAAAGVIPYVSGLPAVDMLGLCDTYVARHGLPTGGKAGHQRYAPLPYLVQRGVHLVLGSPWVRPQAAGTGDTVGWSAIRNRPFMCWAAADLPATAALLVVPLPFGQELLVLYLTPSAAVDAAAARYGWKTIAIARDR